METEILLFLYKNFVFCAVRSSHSGTKVLQYLLRKGHKSETKLVFFIHKTLLSVRFIGTTKRLYKIENT